SPHVAPLFPYTTLFRPERIDAADRSVALASGGTVSYDHLIYAVGSNAGPSTVPGVGEFAYSVTEFEDAQRLRRAVDARPCDAPRSEEHTSELQSRENLV